MVFEKKHCNTSYLQTETLHNSRFSTHFPNFGSILGPRVDFRHLVALEE